MSKMAASPGNPPEQPTLPIRIELGVKTMLAAALVIGCVWIALHLAPVLLVLVIALFLVGTLNPIVAWLEGRGWRRSFGIALVFTAMFSLLLLALSLTVPALLEQIGSLASRAPALREKLQGQLSASRFTQPLAEALKNLRYENLARVSAPVAFEYTRRSVEVVAYLVSAVFLALYIMIDRDRLRGGVYALTPRNHHIRLSRVLLKLERIVGGYIRGQVVTSALMMAFTFVLLSACRVEAALALAVFAGLADVLPYIGVFLSVGPAVAAASAHGPLVFFIVLSSMLAYEEFESRFLVPRIYGNALKLPSSVVLFSLLAGGTLMGIPGALLALPVAATIRMLIEELRLELPGEDIDDSRVRESDARAEREYERRAAGVAAEEAAAIALQISDKRARPAPGS